MICSRWSRRLLVSMYSDHLCVCVFFLHVLHVLLHFYRRRAGAYMCSSNVRVRLCVSGGEVDGLPTS